MGLKLLYVLTGGASALHTPTGYPPTLLFWERHNPQKNYPGNQLLQEYGKLWRVSDLWRIKWGLLTGDDVSDLAMSISVWSVYCFTPSELYLTRKISLSPELMFPLNSPLPGNTNICYCLITPIISSSNPLGGWVDISATCSSISNSKICPIATAICRIKSSITRNLANTYSRPVSRSRTSSSVYVSG